MKLRNIFKKESEKVIKPELCAKYKERLLEFPDTIHHRHLDPIVGSLFSGSYYMALQEVGTIVTKKDQILNTSKRERVRGLLRKAKAVEDETDFKKLFSQYTKESYQIRVIKPGSPTRRLAENLATIGNCWIKGMDALGNEDVMKKISWLQKDIDLGACVFLIGEELDEPGKKYVPKAQTRAYIATTKKDEAILFYDTIESGDVGWCSVGDWVYGQRGRELLYSIAAAIHIAKEYGMKKIGVGEREVQELACSLGFKEEVLFEENRDSRYVTSKIGIKGDTYGEEGPYCYQINRSARCRIIDLDEIKILPQDEITKKLENIVNFLSSFEKTRKNKDKMEEVKMYLKCLRTINEREGYHGSKEISDQISQIQTKYFENEY